MSAFSQYAARCERTTALNRFTSVAVLADVRELTGKPTPVSGDMLAVLSLGTKTQRRSRRKRARGQR